MATFVSTLNGFGALGDVPQLHAQSAKEKIASMYSALDSAKAERNVVPALNEFRAAWTLYGEAKAHVDEAQKANDWVAKSVEQDLINAGTALYEAWSLWISRNQRAGSRI